MDDRKVKNIKTLMQNVLSDYDVKNENSLSEKIILAFNTVKMMNNTEMNITASFISGIIEQESETLNNEGLGEFKTAREFLVSMSILESNELFDAVRSRIESLKHAIESEVENDSFDLSESLTNYIRLLRENAQIFKSENSYNLWSREFNYLQNHRRLN